MAFVGLHHPPIAPFYAASVAANGRYLVDQFGSPFFMVGDSAWGLAVNLPVTGANSMQTYFQTRQSQGLNTALVQLVTDGPGGPSGSYGVNGGAIAQNNAQTYDLVAAFTGTSGSYPDITTPNPAYWQRMDQMVALAASYGITLMLEPTNGGAQNDTGGPSWSMLMLRQNGASACQTFGQFLGGRYGASPNVFWMHGNDYNPNGTDDPLVGGILTGIKSVRSTNLHTLEYGPTPGVSSYSNQAASTWTNNLSLDQAYPTSSANVYVIEQTAYASSPTLPVFQGEWFYENAGVTTYQLRQSYYWTTLTGALGGYLYGNSQLYFFNTGWSSFMSTTAVTQMGYWAALFQSVNWWLLAPDTGNTFLTGGISTGSTLSLAAVAADGSLGVVYCPTTNPVVAMTKMRGPALARWYDPTSGTFTTVGTFANSGSQTFTLPAVHADGNNDYILVLTA